MTLQTRPSDGLPAVNCRLNANNNAYNVFPSLVQVAVAPQNNKIFKKY